MAQNSKTLQGFPAGFALGFCPDGSKSEASHSRLSIQFSVLSSLEKTSAQRRGRALLQYRRHRVVKDRRPFEGVKWISTVFLKLSSAAVVVADVELPRWRWAGRAATGTMSARMKELFQKYGKVAVGVHLTVYAATLAGCYMAVESKVDVESMLQRVHLLKERGETDGDSDGGGWFQNVLADRGSSLVLAFLCTKALLPIRVPLTVGLTPMVARVLRGRAAAREVQRAVVQQSPSAVASQVPPRRAPATASQEAPNGT